MLDSAAFLGIGLKLKVAPSTLLEGFAEADYFSNVLTAHPTEQLLIRRLCLCMSRTTIFGSLRAGARSDDRLRTRRN